jgi:hypothetical protein
LAHPGYLLQTMAPPPAKPIGSLITEMKTLGDTIHRAQRAIHSFSRLAPREIVRGVLDNSISCSATASHSISSIRVRQSSTTIPCNASI